ncbi:hypothetical protein [Cryptosporidium parvum Iowa II]|uniref:Uncharacterized protein n=2 Tax=Cryptosporidium parvum TaxID=5807 RepID=Q5CSY1_CRYPI|nr:hypothetical protein [Cryptosporidium parvum Iowa II]EAK88487.1 hypothetical protein cgd1_900 [Cryptosporidium parvum Iowa II]QOY43537.1 Uncharacterized protein CPATCC_0038470 [Cryptosporidium parvum]WKS75989.1 hypothetical protein CPCDC_1g900 [Cryptosporidium sp. 43IA8]WRK30483.1 Uncharacterized protein cpbgf_100900 [Cryptosporidium parvum]|eukprot:QOY43537.1 hypothetical protein CPATCC_000333 [Cryptosporidium parvum]
MTRACFDLKYKVFANSVNLCFLMEFYLYSVLSFTFKTPFSIIVFIHAINFIEWFKLGELSVFESLFYLPAFACYPLCMACILFLAFACKPVFRLLLPKLLIITFF